MDKKFWIFVMVLWVVCLVESQQSAIFDGHADLSEGEGIKAKALEVARYRALRKAVEYAGVKIKSESSVKDFVLEYDRIVAEAQGEVENTTEIYADWDRGDTSRVLVILQAVVKHSVPDKNSGKDSGQDSSPLGNVDDRIVAGFRQKLEAEIELIVRQCNPEQPWNVGIDEIVHKGTRLCGQFASQIKTMIEEVIEKKPCFKLIRKKGVKIVGYHKITAVYSQENAKIVVSFDWSDPKGKPIHHFDFEMNMDSRRQLTGFLPENTKIISEAMQNEESTGKAGLNLQMSTDKGKEGAIYKHGDKMTLEVIASEACYLQIYYLQANGQIVRIFPNEYHKDNKIQGNRVYNIPDKDYQFDLEIDCSETQGMEMITAIASKEPLAEIQGKDVGHGMKGIKVKARALRVEAKKQGKEVAEAVCTILTQRK